MRNIRLTRLLAAAGIALVATVPVAARDWPQWRGPNRDAKASDFKAPSTWPKELAKKWTVPVGGGVATPSLAGDKLVVFTRQGSDDVVRCLDATTGKELWAEKYPSASAGTPGGRAFEGPRSSPAIADGKVVTFSARGTLSCFDLASGKLAWRKDDLKDYWPNFSGSSSPLIADGICIAHIGGRKGGRGETEGALVAYDLATGAEKWKLPGGSPGYGSPALMTVGDTKLVLAETDSEIVAVNAADGKQVWSAPCKTRYNASSPVVDGQTVIYEGAGPGEKAVRLEKDGDKFVAKDVWANKDAAVIYNSPVIVGGHVYGLTQGNQFFCLDLKDGKTAWTAPAPGTPAGGTPPPGGGDKGGPPGGDKGGKGGKGGRGMGGGRGGYGSIVAAGNVLLALTPRAQLVVFEPGEKEYKQLASYKVSDNQTYAYPIVVGNRIYTKDDESVTLWTVE